MNYLLLGHLVEAMGGETYADFVTHEILEPLESGADLDYQLVSGGRSIGHILNDNLYIALLKTALRVERAEMAFAAKDENYHYLVPYNIAGKPFGGMSGKASDVARFGQSLVGDQHALLTKRSREMMHRRQSDDPNGPSTRPTVWAVD